MTSAASASVLMPLGYHTNLMVMPPGGYRVLRPGGLAGEPAGVVGALGMVWMFWL